MSKNDYKTSYDRENYGKVCLRIPKECYTTVQELAEEKGKSINRLFIEAVEQVYNVDLTHKAVSLEKYIAQKAQCLNDLGIMSVSQATTFFEWVSSQAETTSEKIKLIDSEYSKALNDC